MRLTSIRNRAYNKKIDNFPVLPFTSKAISFYG